MTLSVPVHSGTATGTAADFSNTAYYSSITITNTSTIAAPQTLWARFDGSAAVALADNDYIIPPATTRTFRNPTVVTEPALAVFGTTPVSLIASGSCTFTIQFN